MSLLINAYPEVLLGCTVETKNRPQRRRTQKYQKPELDATKTIIHGCFERWQFFHHSVHFFYLVHVRGEFSRFAHRNTGSPACVATAICRRFFLHLTVFITQEDRVFSFSAQSQIFFNQIRRSTAFFARFWESGCNACGSFS